MNTQSLPDPPSPGELVRLRKRQFLVLEVTPPPQPNHATLVSLSCIDDDAQGEPLQVLWELELDAEIIHGSWQRLGQRDFDSAPRFAAYLHALRWNCVTATDPDLFQAPYRAGIEVMAYQLEPLRKALRLPRVNLFIADDVGLGKTIEAGLVLREMLMRQRVRRIIVAAPPSVVLQWRDELEQRFGLTFVIYDRAFAARCRRDRGYGINPWTTHSRFIVSHALLRDEEYAAPLRDLLGDFDPGSMLILDEAHHAAPAQSSLYAIDSQFTRSIRELASRFEHRLFLSATPHNGLSNSFSALLEILDPQRFCRGTRVEPKLRDEVMVRRLKSDLREVLGGFPQRNIIKIELKNLPDNTPELQLAQMLDEYWVLFEQRISNLPPKQRAAQGLILVHLQKRLFSSIHAFARTLKAHRRALQSAAPKHPTLDQIDLIADSPDREEERAELDEEQIELEQEEAIEALTSDPSANANTKISARELELLEAMESLAAQHAREPDARARFLLDWIREHLCPNLPAWNQPGTSPSAPWNNRRVILFTEYADTKHWLEQLLGSAAYESDRGNERIATFHGGMSDETREQIKRAFQAHPSEHPLRILIATDAAREGVNLQNHCADLFHIDLPWNPSRLEQRNGRIDRKLQRENEVRCHYFVYAQRDADRVLEVLAERTKTIYHELGSMPPVLEENIARRLEKGIAPKRRAQLQQDILSDTQMSQNRTAEEEFESTRERKTDLQKQLERCEDNLSKSKRFLKLNEQELHSVLCESLGMLGAPPLTPLPDREHVFQVPALDRRPGADPTWADTLDTLREPRARDENFWDWRRKAKLRPVVFQAPRFIDEQLVHLHLEHRFVQRLLGRFLAQGFVLDDLARACIAQTEDAIPRVLLLGRLSLYGENAARLHDEIVSIAARWRSPDTRGDGLKPYGDDGQKMSWDLLLSALGDRRTPQVAPEPRNNMLNAAQRDVQELLPHLQKRCEFLAMRAKAKLTERGKDEAQGMRAILEGQRKRIEAELSRLQDPQQTFVFQGFNEEERRQLRDNERAWRKRLADNEKDMESEPARIQAGYGIQATRIEPVGIAYLWPISG